MCVLLITPLLRLLGRLSARKPVKQLQWSDCCKSNWPSLVGPQSLCNQSSWWRFYVVTLLFGCFRGCRGFCHRTESDLFLFLLYIVFRTYATSAACSQRMVTPPEYWSCPILGLGSVLMLRPISPELVLFPDFWVSVLLFCFTEII